MQNIWSGNAMYMILRCAQKYFNILLVAYATIEIECGAACVVLRNVFTLSFLEFCLNDVTIVDVHRKLFSVCNIMDHRF